MCKLSQVRIYTYPKLYPSHFDFIIAPHGWRLANFYRFNSEDSKSTMEHISLFLAQMGEATTLDFMNVPSFLLSLSAIVFSWFTSSRASSIGSWAQLEERFH